MPARPLALGLRGPNRVAIGRVRRMVAALRRLGGSLWMVDTAFSGAFVDNVGTTPVTAYADLLGLTTDRLGVLGPNLCPTFDSGAWTTAGTDAPNWTRSGGVASVVGDGVSLGAGSKFMRVSGVFAANKSYEVSFEILASNNVGGMSVQNNNDNVPLGWVKSVGKYRYIHKSGGANPEMLGVQAISGWTGSVGPITARELTGSHATQSAVASKPSVQRVPKRLGPNRITNGTFDVDTSGWTSAGGVHTWVAGALRRTTGQGDAGSYQDVSGLTPGKSYQFRPKMSNITLVAGVAAYVYVGPGFGALIGSVLGATQTPLVFTATSSTVRVYLYTNSTSAADFDDIEVCEVLEWATVISFDPNNDFLTAPVSSVTTGETLIVGCTPTGGVGTNRAALMRRDDAAKTGMMIYADAANTYQVSVGNGLGFVAVAFNAAATLNQPIVLSALGNAAARTVTTYRNGQLQSIASTVDPVASVASPVYIGALAGTFPFPGYVYGGARIPVAMSDADRLIVEQGIAALQGRTL